MNYAMQNKTKMEQQPRMNLSIDQTLPVECEKCNHTFFEEALHIRKASGILTGTGQTTYMPIPVFACKACGHVNTEFLPKELKHMNIGE
jgi:uncharacterized Zn finger protein